ncbi:MAG: heavy metal translocating P-type ATPase [Proteobacteria bacterium]|nr:heavy metal translocating P-type ATPase [Pseudomonadota bacterium]
MAALTLSRSLFEGDESFDPAPFVRRDAKGIARLELLVKGARCANCLAKIENGVKALDGVREARLNLSTGKLAVTWTGNRLAPAAILRRVTELGYDARAYDPGAYLENEKDEGRALLTCLAVAGFGSVFVVGLTDSVWYGGGDMSEATRNLFFWIAGAVSIPTALFAGRPFFRSAFKSLSAGHANMDVPIGLSILLSLALSVYLTVLHDKHSYFDAAVMLPFLLLIGRYLDFAVRRKAKGAARDLAAMQAVTVRKLDTSGLPQSVAARDVAVGDRLLLAAGERVAVDGVIEDHGTTADLSLVTGESEPVAIGQGEMLRAGSIVMGRAIVLKASARVENSLVAEISRLIEAGQQSRSRYVKLADRAARLYVPVVHGLALSVFLFWFVAMDAGITLSLKYAISLLIITCPCALGLAVPAVQIVATGILFRRGLLVKSGDALERLAEADIAIFDKTGTLTRGRPVPVNLQAISQSDLKKAARLARASRHPLARALAGAAVVGDVASGVRETGGEGIETSDRGLSEKLGSAIFVGATAQDMHQSELWYREGTAAPVRFAFSDPLRSDTPQTLRTIASQGLKIEMLSGDRDGVAATIAREAGIDQWRGQTGPVEKTHRLEELRKGGHKVLMVGDGLNDAASLALAHVSISPGTAVDAAQAAADMVLQGESLAPIGDAIAISRQARRRVLENFAFAIAYNAVAIPLAAFGLVTPLIAALAMAGSSLIVTLNALRLAASTGGAR